MSSERIQNFTSLRIKGVPPFRVEEIEFDLDPRVNVFIGSNATGKSTILKVLAFRINAATIRGSGRRLPLRLAAADGSQLPLLTDVPHIYLSPVRASLDDLPDVESDPWLDVVGDEELQLQGLQLPDNPAYNEWFASPGPSMVEFLDGQFFVDGIGAFGDRATTWYSKPGDEKSNSSDPWSRLFHCKNWAPWQTLLGQDVGDVFNPEKVYFAMRRLYMEGQNNSTGDHSHKVRDVAYGCTQRICSEVLLGTRPGDTLIAEQAPEDNYDEVHRLPRLDFATSFQTPDTDPNSPVNITLLSTGTQGLYLWILYVAIRIGFYYDFFGNWKDKPAILLIDEIENHLHPTWQRRVIPALLEYFPGLQIFATTHSPFVVAGLKQGQVHVLGRDDDGIVRVSTNERDVIGWTADEVLRNLMGVKDPTDDATAAAADELRELRNAGPLVDEKDEEERQKRIAELRRHVDRDLLEGGPMAAQRELFEQQFAEALENFRRTQSLQQENN